MRRGTLGALVVLLAVGSAPLDAQRGPPARRGAADRAQLEQRLRARMGQLMQERLGLTAEQGESLGALVRSFDEERRELQQLEQATRRRIEALLLEGATDQTEARELLERMADLRAREAELFRREQERLLELLEPAQVLQFHALRQELAQRIRQLRGRDGGGGPPWGGIGGHGNGASGPTGRFPG